MLIYALILFAVAAAGGLIMAARLFSGKLAPWALSLVHALLGAGGLAVMIAILLQGEGAARITAAFALLVVAALGGFFLLSFHIRDTLAPRGVVLVHAGVAVAGFLTLLSVALGL